MFIIKNALRSITRSLGRNILLGIIVLVIAVSACIGLSIKQASETAKQTALNEINVTATISFDRMSAMKEISNSESGNEGGFDKSQFSKMMSETESLTLEEYQKYAEAESVSDFYYTVTTYVNGSDEFTAVSDSSSDDIGANQEGEDDLTKGSKTRPGNMGDMTFSGVSGDFTIVGYSCDAAMTDFINETSSIVEGAMFEEGTEKNYCVISDELARYNMLSVGDLIVVQNTGDETETFTLTISGTFVSNENNDMSMNKFGSSQDPANKILMSAAAVNKIVSSATTEMSSTISATYCFESIDDYNKFDSEARALGLDDSYTISSNDIASYEASITPLTSLDGIAKWFLIIILSVGAVVLIVLNIFNVRDRKYEVGVLTAMGMKKWKVAAQFMCEILVVTMVAVIIGTGIGAATSLPVANALLKTQTQSQTEQKADIDTSFGRESNFDFQRGGRSMPGGNAADGTSDGIGGAADGTSDGFSGGRIGGNEGGGKNIFDIGGVNAFENVKTAATNYITKVDSAMNLTVVWQMLLVGIALTIISGLASLLFIMRYDPLKILANRD